MATNDYYTTLGVPKNASEKEIRQAYRRLARQYHPDVNPGDKTAEAKFKRINAAYEVLSDAGNRKKFDRYGDQWEHADQIEAMQGRPGSRAFRFGPGGATFQVGGIGDLGGVFETFFGGGRGRASRKKPEAEHRIEVTLEEAFHGATRTLEIASHEPCATCGGSGQIASAVCHLCQGRGVVQKSRRIEVKVPPGVATGSRIRIAGDSKGDVRGGGPAGFVLVVSVPKHPRFERKGDDLYVDLDVSLTDAILGAEVEVPTITGQVMLKVPPLTQNDKLFRLAKLGMPKLKGKGRGDLHARLRVKLPEQLSEREQQLFEELRAAASEKPSEKEQETGNKTGNKKR